MIKMMYILMRYSYGEVRLLFSQPNKNNSSITERFVLMNV